MHQCYWTHRMIGEYLIAMFKTKGINCAFKQINFKSERIGDAVEIMVGCNVH